MVENPPVMQETWVGKTPWRREWQLTPACLPGEFHGHRSLVGCHPWSCKESDMTKGWTLTEKIVRQCEAAGKQGRRMRWEQELSLLTTAKVTKVSICWSLERFLPVWKSERFPHLWNVMHHCSTEGFRLFLPALPFLHGPLLIERESLTSGRVSLSLVPSVPKLSVG